MSLCNFNSAPNRQLRSENPLELIFGALPAHPIVLAARADISFIINELFVNALDHGVLCLDSALKEQEDGMLEYFSQRARLEHPPRHVR